MQVSTTSGVGPQKSKLSRHVLQVEERLGVRLLNRSSRRFSVAEIGREFCDRCVAMLVEPLGQGRSWT
jgi:DNA-binding transcriptional LysR family regulator